MLKRSLNIFSLDVGYRRISDIKMYNYSRPQLTSRNEIVIGRTKDVSPVLSLSYFFFWFYSQIFVKKFIVYEIVKAQNFFSQDTLCSSALATFVCFCTSLIFLTVGFKDFYFQSLSSNFGSFTFVMV